MSKYSLVVVFIIMFTTRSIAQSDLSQLRKHINELELAHARAIFKGDATAMDTLMDDNVTVNHPTNRIVNEKKELLALIRDGVIRYTSFERIPEKFLFFDNTVIVMGSESVVPAPGAPNEGKTLQRRYTNMWMLKDSKWVLVVRHAHIVCSN